MITGEGLVLRVPEPSDRERWLDLLHDPDELRFGLPAFVAVPQTVAELDGRVAEAGKAFAAVEPGTLVVADAADPGHLLGVIAWRMDAHPPMRIADIGYGVHPDSRNRGIARRAIRVFVRWLALDANGPHLARVQLDHSVENLASCRVALAAGLEQEGVRRSFLPLRDNDSPDGVRRHDVCLHGIVASEVDIDRG